MSQVQVKVSEVSNLHAMRCVELGLPLLKTNTIFYYSCCAGVFESDNCFSTECRKVVEAVVVTDERSRETAWASFELVRTIGYFRTLRAESATASSSRNQDCIFIQL